MKPSVIYRPAGPASAAPYRVLGEYGQEIAWANAFLDAQCVRQLSPRSLRAYAYDLLHFARWWGHHRPLPEITESTLLDYVRYQLDQQPKPTPQTVNHRLCVLHCLYRFHSGCEIPAGRSHFQRIYTTRPLLRYGRPRRAVASGLRLKQPRRVIVPLSAEDVAKFWASFRTFRDLAPVGLMLLDGLRSCEVLALQIEDLQLGDAQMWGPRQGPQETHPATARRTHRSPAKLFAVGTAPHPLPLFIRFAQRPPARSADDLWRTPLAVPSPSDAQ